MASADRPGRHLPAVPPPGQIERPLRVLIDADAANEVDDQYAIALALFSPQRIELRGLVAAHFGDRAGPAGIEQSYEEILRILELAGASGTVPVRRGSHPLRDLLYDHGHTHGRMQRVYHVDRRGTFDLFTRTLEEHAPR